MNRKLWENMLSLLSVQALNYVAPLITLPFLARVLGPDNWGKLAFAEAYANYASLLIEYGFGLSATREVAQASHDEQLHSRLLANVLVAQALLTVLTGLCTVIILCSVPSMGQYAEILPLALLLAASRAATPLWYFLGLERMRLVALINIFVNLCSAGMIIALVHSPDQLWVPLQIRAAAAVAAAIAAVAIAYKNLHFTAPTLSEASKALKSGWSIFLFKSAVSLYTTGNVLLMGLLAPASAIAWFAGAERIAKAGTTALGPITQTFYPRITGLLRTDINEAKRIARTSVKFTVGCGILSGTFLFLAAPRLVRILLGPSYGPTVPVLQCLALLPPLIAGSTALGIQWMLPLRLDGIYTKIILGAGLLNVALACTLAPIYKQMGMALSVTAAELFVTVGVLLVLRLRGLDPWSSTVDTPTDQSLVGARAGDPS